MKLLTLLVLFISVSWAECNDAASPRPWTDAKTQKVIRGTIIDKKEDSSQVHILLENGKKHWIKSIRLTKKDQDFISNWEKPFNYLEFKELKDDSGKITSIQVTFRSGKQNAGVLAQPTKASGSSFSFITHRLQAGEKKVFEIEPNKEYKFAVSDETGAVLFKTVRKPIKR